jgi:hypothetical protein
MNEARALLGFYANEFPYSGINRANAAPKTFEALRKVLDECDRAWTDACPERKRLITNIRGIIENTLTKPEA